MLTPTLVTSEPIWESLVVAALFTSPLSPSSGELLIIDSLDS
jgi:hypothetical protein